MCLAVLEMWLTSPGILDSLREDMERPYSAAAPSPKRGGGLPDISRPQSTTALPGLPDAAGNEGSRPVTAGAGKDG